MNSRYMEDNTSNNNYYIITLELGIVVLNSNRDIIYFNKFTDPIDIHEKIKEKQYSEIIKIIEDLEVFKNKTNIKMITNIPEIRNLLIEDKKFESIEKCSQSVEKYIQLNKLHLYLQSNFFSNEKEIIDNLRDFSLNWSSIKIQEASEQIDLHISQSINALDEIDKISNTLATRMREWYGLHFPEIDNLLQNPGTYANIVYSCGKRENISSDFLKTLDIPDNKIEIITQVSTKSRGGKITDQNLSIVQDIAEQVISLNRIRKNLEEHIEISMQDIAPNVKGLLTASVGARLISKAGSLKKLSSLSASTIQILGAEKALFRTLKTGSNPPKHGILFQHPVIHSAPKWQRGKMARAIAAKTAIAARMDVYGHSSEANQLLSDKLTDRLKEIQEKYKEPPTVEEKPPGFRGNRGGFGRDRNRRNRGDGGGSDAGKRREWQEKGQGGGNPKYRKNKSKRYHKSNKK
ncbi:MAG TPA: hypothetical protein VIY08_04160 [Candidatus Nitrosocosmicus sp.]